MESCILTCLSCGQRVRYIAKETKECMVCGKELSIEAGVESLVVALNNAGVETESSCEGVEDDNDSTRDYPWITIRNESKHRADLILAIYNQRHGELFGQEWVITADPTSVGSRWFLKPKNIHEWLNVLSGQASYLSRFIASNFSLGDS